MSQIYQPNLTKHIEGNEVPKKKKEQNKTKENKKLDCDLNEGRCFVAKRKKKVTSMGTFRSTLEMTKPSVKFMK